MSGMKRQAAALAAMAVLAQAGCYRFRPGRGGGQSSFAGERKIRPQDVAVPPGYVVEVAASGLTFPTSLFFDDADRAYVVEAGYAAGETWTTPRVLRLEPDDLPTVIVEGGRNGPWTGAAYLDGRIYIAEGGELEGGKILALDPQDPNLKLRPVVEGLPSTGDHHTSGPVVGPDGLLYFGEGTMTNAGVVGDDNELGGWVERFPAAHDVPCVDVALSGVNFGTKKGPTGAFLPYGTPSRAGQIVPAGSPCNGAVYRVKPDGCRPELVAWGLRDPFGLAFSPKGALFATDAGYDERGARPVWGAADFLWSISTGTPAWYGWPDYSGSSSLAQAEYASAGRARPAALLDKPPAAPPQPAATLACHAGSAGLDFSRSESFGHVGEAFIAQFGDRGPRSGKVARPVGFKVVRVNLATGVIEDFAVNRGRVAGPASLLRGGGLERPIAVRFSPSGSELYIVDFGAMTFSKSSVEAARGTGVVWRVRRRD